MQSKKISILLIGAFALALFCTAALSVAFAQEESNSLSTEMRSRITNLAANVSNKTEAAHTRLQNILTRMESRATALDTTGYDMTDTRFYINEARKSLIEAEAVLSDIDGEIAAIVSSENPYAAWTVVRDIFTESKSKLMNAKKLMGEAVAEMKLTVAEGIPSTPTETDSSSPATTN